MQLVENLNLEKWIKKSRQYAFIILSIVPLSVLFIDFNLIFPYISTKHLLFRLLIVVAIFFAALALVLSVNWKALVKSKIFLLYSTFIFVIAVSNVFAVYPDYAWWGYFERMGGFISSAYYYIYFVLLLIFVDKSKWIYIFRVYFIVSLIVILFAFLKYKGLGTRADAIFGNPIYLAIFSLFHIAFSFLLAAKTTIKYEKYLALFSSIFAVILIFLTATRSVILSLFIGVLAIAAYLAFKYKGRYLIAFILVLTFGVSSLVFLQANKDKKFVQDNYVLKRISEISLNSPTVQSRIVAATSIAWPAIKDRPFVGWGQEGFNYVFYRYYDPDIVKYDKAWFDRAHNNYIDIAVQNGVIAALLYLLILFYSLYIVLKNSKSFTELEMSALLFIFVAHAFYLLSMFDNLSNVLPFTLLLAYLARSELKDSDLFVDLKKYTSNTPLLLYFLILAIILFLSQQIWYSYKTSKNIIEVYRLSEISEQLTEAYKQLDKLSGNNKKYLQAHIKKVEEEFKKRKERFIDLIYSIESSKTSRREFIVVLTKPQIIRFVTEDRDISIKHKSMYFMLMNRLYEYEMSKKYINYKHLYHFTKWLMAKGEYAKAEKTLEKLIKEAPLFTQFYIDLAVLKLKLDKPKEAEDYTRQALKIYDSKQTRLLLDYILKYESSVSESKK